MHQILISSLTENPASLQRVSGSRTARWTVSAGIQALRQEAASLRAACQARLAQAATSALTDDFADLLQRADMLDRGADVLALTSRT